MTHSAIMPAPLLLLPAVAAVLLSSTPAAAEPALLTGDLRLACEAVLCLSSAQRPAECTPSLQRYFGIKHRRATHTLNARRSFLQLCPAAQQEPLMQTLVAAIAGGAGHCDATTLNMVLRYDNNDRPFISNRLPAHCSSYFQHPYTQLQAPRYQGQPEYGGHWR